MSENKLTNEEIARVFAMYLGCEVEYYDYFTNAYERSIFTGNAGDFIWVKDTQHGEEIDKARLLLTPLSAITDEHAIEFAKLNKYTTGSSDEAFIIVAKDIIKRVSNPEKYATNQMCYPYDAYLYLIQQSYAVPLFFGVNHWANGKTAIELEIAIDRIKI